MNKILSYAEFKQRIVIAFKALRKQGYICRQDFWCCQSCGCSAISQMKKAKGQDNPKFVFWHHQDTSGFHDATSNFSHRMRGYERLKAMNVGEPELPNPPGLYVSWGGDGEAIVKALNDAKLVTDWDGTAGQQIWISAEVHVLEELFEPAMATE
jgi:hypothetical protein